MNLRRHPKKRKITDADDFGRPVQLIRTDEQSAVHENNHTNTESTCPTTIQDTFDVSPGMNPSAPLVLPFELGLQDRGISSPDDLLHTTWNDYNGELWELHNDTVHNHIQIKTPKVYGRIKDEKRRSLLTSMLAVFNIQMITEVTSRAITRIGPLHRRVRPTKWTLLRVYIFFSIELCVLGWRYHPTDGLVEKGSFDKSVKFLCKDWYRDLRKKNKQHYNHRLPYIMYCQMRGSIFIDHTQFATVSKSFRS